MSTIPLTHEHFQQRFIETCTQSFDITPYHWQHVVGANVLFANNSRIPVKMLLIRPTSGGKTLVFTTIAACLKGITICITPLLSLGADQFRKLFFNTHRDHSISAFHIDEM